MLAAAAGKTRCNCQTYKAIAIALAAWATNFDQSVAFITFRTTVTRFVQTEPTCSAHAPVVVKSVE